MDSPKKFVFTFLNINAHKFDKKKSNIKPTVTKDGIMRATLVITRLAYRLIGCQVSC